MKTAVKKPIPVPYKQWTGANYLEVIAFAGESDIKPLGNIDAGCSLALVIKNNAVQVHVGDYILRDVTGMCYKCPKDVFESTYDTSGRDAALVAAVNKLNDLITVDSKIVTELINARVWSNKDMARAVGNNHDSERYTFGLLTVLNHLFDEPGIAAEFNSDGKVVRFMIPDWDPSEQIVNENGIRGYEPKVDHNEKF